MSNPRDTSCHPGEWPGTSSNSKNEAGELYQRGLQDGTTLEMRGKHVNVDETKATGDKVKVIGNKKMDETGALLSKWSAGSPLVNKEEKVRFSPDARDREEATAFSHTVHPSKPFQYIADGEMEVETEKEASGDKFLVLTGGEPVKGDRQSFDSGEWIPLL